MIAGSHKLARTPPANNPKRKLENDFSNAPDQDADNDHAKKLNLSNKGSDSDPINSSASKFERNMFEAQFTEHLMRINKLEQELMHSKTEKEQLDYELNNLKRKQEEEKRDMIESKHNLEMALKSTKSNNEILNGELKHLMEKADIIESGESEKAKEIEKLKTQIEELIEEKNSSGPTFDRQIDDLKYQLESKNTELEQYENVISKMKGSSSEFKSKYDVIHKENTNLQNKIRDLEELNSKLEDNSENLNNFMDQSSKIDNLERENRRLVLDLETAKANQEENLIIKEELKSKESQIERYMNKIVAAELENSKLAEKLAELSKAPKETSSSTLDSYKQRVKELDLEVIKHRESYEKINELLSGQKKKINEKDEQIRLISNQLANINTERNCYKKMVTDIDAERDSTDSTKSLEIQVREYQNIINQYKKIYPDLTEMKLCNDTSIHLEEESIIEGLTPSSSQDSIRSARSTPEKNYESNDDTNKTVIEKNIKAVKSRQIGRKPSQARKNTRKDSNNEVEGEEKVLSPAKRLRKTKERKSSQEEIDRKSPVKDKESTKLLEEPVSSQKGEKKTRGRKKSTVKEIEQPLVIEQENSETVEELTPLEEPILSQKGEKKTRDKKNQTAVISDVKVSEYEASADTNLDKNEIDDSPESLEEEEPPQLPPKKTRGKKKTTVVQEYIEIEEVKSETVEEVVPISQEESSKPVEEPISLQKGEKKARGKKKQAIVMPEADTEPNFDKNEIDDSQESLEEEAPKKTRGKKKADPIEPEIIDQTKGNQTEFPESEEPETEAKKTRVRRKAAENKSKPKKAKEEEDIEDDDEATVTYDPTSPAHSPLPIRPQGRMTKAKEIAMIKAERKRVVQAKLATLQNETIVDIPEDRPRVVKFNNVVEDSNLVVQKLGQGEEEEVISEPKAAPKKRKTAVKKK